MKKNQALFTSARQNWCTPNEILELVRKFTYKGQIDFDPCDSPLSLVGSVEHCYGFDDRDGLKESWRGKGLVWCNPPYDQVKEWVHKAAEEFSRPPANYDEQDDQLFVLVPARTDTKWFKNLLMADKLCFLFGRLKFVGAPSSAPFPSVIAYWGPSPSKFVSVFTGKGWFR